MGRDNDASIIESALERFDDGLSPAPPISPPEADNAAAPLASAAGAHASAPGEATAGGRQRGKRAIAPAREGAREMLLDLARLRHLGMLTPDSTHTRLAEEYRVLKRPLLERIAERTRPSADNANLILVTSALPDEGKTYTAANLAMSIAMEMDQTVLLVDGDVVHCGLGKLLQNESAVGFTDLLGDQGTRVEEVLVRTNVPTLNFIPAGRRYPSITELLASEEMRRLARELSQRYDDRVVVFDSPPLLATTSARALANVVGQVLLVVEAEKTPQSTVRTALELLDPSLPVGLVLNKGRRGAQPEARYGYYEDD